MKTSLYLYLAGCLFITAQREVCAQKTANSVFGTAFRKGSVQLTATYGYGQGQLVSNRDIISVRAGYYLADRLMLGAMSSLTKEWDDVVNTKRRFSVGPLVRYQFTSTRLSPFVSVAYQFGRPTFSPNANQAVLLTPGANFALSNLIRLEASYELLVVPYDDRIGQAQMGVTLLFGNRK